MLRLGPREVPEPMDEMTPLVRGALVHEVQFRVQRELRDAGALPVTGQSLPRALGVLDSVIDAVAARYRDDCRPVAGRVWEDGIIAVRADLREWLRRAVEGQGRWIPWRFEYAFGLPDGHAGREGELQDADSAADPVRLSCGIRLRGKIDLVERDAAGRLRVTDYKTGRVRLERGGVVQGGQVLQPLLYALAARELFGAEVESGRLYYCTRAGGFADRSVPVNAETTRAADAVARAVRLAIERGFLPAAPVKDGCRYCDYVVVCGRREERRVQLKGRRALQDLVELRALP